MGPRKGEKTEGIRGTKYRKNMLFEHNIRNDKSFPGFSNDYLRRELARRNREHVSAGFILLYMQEWKEREVK